MKKLSSLSVFLPCYNEAKNIPHLVKDLTTVLPQITKKFEVIVVNDGSHDHTIGTTHRLQKKYPFLRLVSHEKNMGYGAAVHSGLMAATYDWVFLTDGDGQFDVRELIDFLPWTTKYNAVIGYRKNRAEGWKRHFNAQLFKLYIQLLFRIKVKDIDCAFKLLKKEKIPLTKLKSRGAMISTELLYYLRKRKVALKELPVSHYPRKFGVPTGNHPRVIVKALRESLQLRIRLLTS
ncbi:MAG TPA: glycosyltransferase family 2 protein [Patescibacteria group bacterium]